MYLVLFTIITSSFVDFTAVEWNCPSSTDFSDQCKSSPGIGDRRVRLSRDRILGRVIVDHNSPDGFGWVYYSAINARFFESASANLNVWWVILPAEDYGVIIYNSTFYYTARYS